MEPKRCVVGGGLGHAVCDTFRDSCLIPEHWLCFLHPAPREDTASLMTLVCQPGDSILCKQSLHQARNLAAPENHLGNISKLPKAEYLLQRLKSYPSGEKEEALKRF